MASSPDQSGMLTGGDGHLLLDAMTVLIADLLARAGRGPERGRDGGPSAPPGPGATGWFVD